MSAFVPIASYLDLPLAELAKAKLESEGIYCHLQNKHHIGVNWLYSNALGGVKLFVKKEDQEIAKAILENDESSLLDNEDLEIPEPESDEQCGNCGSTDLEFVNRARLSGLLMLLNIPAPFWGKYIRCKECGNKMKVRSD